MVCTQCNKGFEAEDQIVTSKNAILHENCVLAYALENMFEGSQSYLEYLEEVAANYQTSVKEYVVKSYFKGD